MRQGSPSGMLLARIASRLAPVIQAGTSGYPPKVRRRLASVNVVSYTIAISCALFALIYAWEDARLYRDPILINLGMMLAAICAPAFHRINEIASALFLAFSVLGGLFLIVGLVGRLSGIQINFVATSAVAFPLMDLKRLKLIVTIITVAIALHLCAWVLFPVGAISGDVREIFLVQLYFTTVVTITIIVGVLSYYAFWTAEQAEARTERLLGLILPASVVERLTERPGQPIADSFASVAVLFSDIVSFVPLAKSLGPARTVEVLNQLVRSFDRLAAEHGVEKIKTIGDSYMAVSGLPHASADSAARLARVALGMQTLADRTAQQFGIVLRLRIGIALGPVMAGVIGAERFTYDVWGDPVNLAARLESFGEPERIQVSSAFRDQLAEEFEFAHRGAIEIKGVGEQDTWFLIGEKGSPGATGT